MSGSRHIGATAVVLNKEHHMTNEASNISKIRGNVQGGMVNISGTQTTHGSVTVTIRDMSQNLQTIPNMDAASRDELSSLISEIRSIIASIPAQHQKDAAKVAKRVEELIDEASTEDVEREAVESKAGLLNRAVEAVSRVLPAIAPTAAKLIDSVLRTIK
jgi:hypothetical protein